jgi:hypothetical protein
VCALSGFIVLFAYYLLYVHVRIVRLTDRLNDPEIVKQFAKNFARAGRKTFSDNIYLMIAFYIPVMTALIFFMGQDNHYYNFFVFFICFFFVIYFGYFTLNIWYVRTYPMGRMGIPVIKQRLRDKVVSLVLPIILIASVIIAVAVYLINSRIIEDEINEKIHYALKSLTMSWPTAARCRRCRLQWRKAAGSCFTSIPGARFWGRL